MNCFKIQPSLIRSKLFIHNFVHFSSYNTSTQRSLKLKFHSGLQRLYPSIPTMDINTSNFVSQYQFISNSLKSASFIAMDLEMTGVSLNGNQKPHHLQNLQDRYMEQKEVAESFLPIQLGLCPFIQDPESNQLIARPFNLILFPKDRNFYLNSSSVTFLRKNGLSFDSWIEKGIDFNPFPSSPIIIKKDPLAEQSHELDIYNPEFRKNLSTILETWKSDLTQPDKLNIKAGNRYSSKLCLQLAQECFDDTVKYFEIPNGFQFIREPTEQIMSLDVYSLMQIIKDHKIPIIGHHMQLDLTFLLHHFYGTLPETIEEWKKAVNEHFPCVIDTRYLASQHPIISKFLGNSLSLSKLMDVVKMQPFAFDPSPITIDSKFPNEDSLIGSNSYHNAGYDAFCTGKVFTHFYRYLYNREFTNNTPLPSPTIESESIPTSISEHFNRLPQVWSYFPYISLDNTEPPLTPQPHHFLVYPIPLDIDESDLKTLLKPIIPTRFDLNSIRDQSLLKLSNAKPADCQKVPTGISLGELWDTNNSYKPKLVSNSGERWSQSNIEEFKQIKIYSWDDFCHLIQPDLEDSESPLEEEYTNSTAVKRELSPNGDDAPDSVPLSQSELELPPAKKVQT